MKVTNGEGTQEMSAQQAGSAVRDYLAEHGSTLEYVRFNENGSIELKAPHGFKVVLRPSTTCDVLLC